MILNIQKETNLRPWTSKKGKKFNKPVTRTVCRIKCDHCGLKFERFGHEIAPHRRTNDYSHFCDKCSGQAAVKGQKSRRAKLDKMLGDKQIDASGYTTIYVGKTHPYSKDYGGRIREHVLVMERHLKRSLNTDKGKRRTGNAEVVHHIDGDKQNNDLSNLQVMTVADHNVCHGAAGNLIFDLYNRGIVGYNRVEKRYFIKDLP